MAQGKTKGQVQAELNLDALPDDELMGLLAELAQLGGGSVPSGPDAAQMAQAYTPAEVTQELETAVVGESIGGLLARARAEAGLSLGAVGADIGVSRARIGQLEKSDNLEIATLERVARTLGYQVTVSLDPLHPNTASKSLRLTLGSPPRLVAQAVLVGAPITAPRTLVYQDLGLADMGIAHVDPHQRQQWFLEQSQIFVQGSYVSNFYPQAAQDNGPVPNPRRGLPLANVNQGNAKNVVAA